MNKQKADRILKDIGKMVEEYAEKNGMKLLKKSGSYDDESLDVKFTIMDKPDGKEFGQTEFEKYASWFGLKPDDFGKTFVECGKQYKIVRLNIAARKRPVIIADENGKEYNATAEFVTRLLHGDEKAEEGK